MKKNIATITFHASHNYGSVLQAYALQNAIKREFYCDCEIINFIKPEQVEMYSIFEKNNSIKKILKNIRTILFKYQIIKNRHNSFNVFIKDRLKLSENEYHSEKELEKARFNYDTIICGSDQIWNLGIKDFDYAYFLGFIKNVKKIAYSPSFGGSNPIKNSDDKNKIKNYLKDFTALSVRENLGIEILNNLTNKEIEEVVDPTLLLESREWDIIASDRIIKKDYIFFYSIDYNDDVVRMVKKISKQLNLPVVVLYTTAKTYKIMFSGFELSKKESPEDFLSLIKYAKLVLSNSFHGNVFSIIYRKPFYVLRGTYNGKINNDNRLTTLLEKFNIPDREININTINDIKISTQLDYSNSEEKIKHEIEKSIKFLVDAIIS